MIENWLAVLSYMFLGLVVDAYIDDTNHPPTIITIVMLWPIALAGYTALFTASLAYNFCSVLIERFNSWRVKRKAEAFLNKESF